MVILWLMPILLVLFFKVRNPPMSAHMLQTNWQLQSQANSKGIVHQWVAAEDIGSKISLAAIIAEDIYFFIHAGFDWESMRLAFEANKNNQYIRGGSTITQQVVKNLFLWPARSYLRKIVEAYFTILVEGCWSKRRIFRPCSAIGR